MLRYRAEIVRADDEHFSGRKKIDHKKVDEYIKTIEDKQVRFVFSTFGITCLLMWFPGLVGLTMLLVDKQGVTDGLNLGHLLAMFFVGLGAVMRIFFFEVRLGVFRKLMFILRGPLPAVYEYIMLECAIMMLLLALLWQAAEARNHHDDMHSVLGSTARYYQLLRKTNMFLFTSSS